VSEARNHGAREATGAWLAFCDDDDLWAPRKLSRQLEAAATGNRGWAYGGAVLINDALTVLSGAPPPAPESIVSRLPRTNAVPGGSSNAIVRADVFRQAGGWDPRLQNLADWDLWIRLAQSGVPACVAEPLVAYRIHATNASRNRALILEEAKVLDGRYHNRIDYGALHHYLGWVCLRSGLPARALGQFARAMFHGQLRGVSRSAAILIDARLRRLTSRPARYYHSNAWRQRADAWLGDLRRTMDGTGAR
jgi:glycosyltransferase involved in cell wall biosynthesis